MQHRAHEKSKTLVSTADEIIYRQLYDDLITVPMDYAKKEN